MYSRSPLVGRLQTKPSTSFSGTAHTQRAFADADGAYEGSPHPVDKVEPPRLTGSFVPHGCSTRTTISILAAGLSARIHPNWSRLGARQSRLLPALNWRLPGVAHNAGANQGRNRLLFRVLRPERRSPLSRTECDACSIGIEPRRCDGEGHGRPPARRAVGYRRRARPECGSRFW